MSIQVINLTRYQELFILITNIKIILYSDLRKISLKNYIHFIYIFIENLKY